MVQTDKNRPADPTPVFQGIRKVVKGDTQYPRNLQPVEYAPYYLYYRGTLQPSDAVSVAVIGSRDCTPGGAELAFAFGLRFAQAGLTVVSGLARGIDLAAHRGAMAAGGRTLAVVGCGLNAIFPWEHRYLAGSIQEQGAVISERDPDSPATRRTILRRNHILTGMAQVVVVVEAEERSGSAAALRGALAQGRPVGLSWLLKGEPWARDLVESGQAFFIGTPDDVVRRVEF